MQSSSSPSSPCPAATPPKRKQTRRGRLFHSSPASIVTDLRESIRSASIEGIVRCESPWESRKKAIRRRKSLPEFRPFFTSDETHMSLAASCQPRPRRNTGKQKPKSPQGFQKIRDLFQGSSQSKSPDAQVNSRWQSEPRELATRKESQEDLNARWQSSPRQTQRSPRGLGSPGRGPPRQPVTDSQQMSPRLPKRQNSGDKDKKPKPPSHFRKTVSRPSMETNGSCTKHELESLKRRIKVRGMKPELYTPSTA